MKIGVIGMGKLGLPVALAIESKGHQVIGYDVSDEPYTYLANRNIPYKEEGLQPLLDNNHVTMVRSVDDVVTHADIIFLPVQTPHEPQYEGSTRLPADRADFNYNYLKEAINSVVQAANEQERPITLAVISTCLPGTYQREIRPLLSNMVEYVYTPQFIAMGTVLEDYLHPEFNLIGVEDEAAANKLEEFYKTINDAPALRTDITTAEGVKVAYNTFITMKTVLGNAWGELSQKLGMNVDDILKSWGMSGKRLLSTKYLRSGVGDGGGCHPRDNIALSYLADKVEISHNIFDDLMHAREDHMGWIGDLAVEEADDSGLPIIILGRSFKPETNIETGSPANLLASLLKENDTEVAHYEDLAQLTQAVYVIGTQHTKYQDYEFPSGSVVIDPFRYIPQRSGIKLVSIGKH